MNESYNLIPLDQNMDNLIYNPNPNSLNSVDLRMDYPNPILFSQISIDLEMNNPNPILMFQNSIDLGMDNPNSILMSQKLEKGGRNENSIDNTNKIMQNPLDERMNHLTDNLNKINQYNPIEGGMKNFIDNSTPTPQNLLEERINNFIDNPNDINDAQNSLPTGYNNAEKMPNPQQISLSNIEAISSNSIKKAVIISKNNKTNIGILNQNLNNSEIDITNEKTKNTKKKNLVEEKKA